MKLNLSLFYLTASITALSSTQPLVGQSLFELVQLGLFLPRTDREQFAANCSCKCEDRGFVILRVVRK